MAITRILMIIGLLVASANAQALDSVQRPISGDYGTVSYSATVSRAATGNSYVIDVRGLTLTFHPDAEVNSTTSIVNPKLRVAMTYLAPGAKRSTLLSETMIPLHLTLDKDHVTAHASNLRFVVDKQQVDNSTHTVLSLTDGHLLWPFPNSQLKP